MMHELLSGRNDICLFSKPHRDLERPDELISGTEASIYLFIMVEYPNEKLWNYSTPLEWPKKYTWNNMLTCEQVPFRSYCIKTSDLVPLLKSKELPEPKHWVVDDHAEVKESINQKEPSTLIHRRPKAQDLRPIWAKRQAQLRREDPNLSKRKIAKIISEETIAFGFPDGTIRQTLMPDR
jgi:hypothetical protein